MAGGASLIGSRSGFAQGICPTDQTPIPINMADTGCGVIEVFPTSPFILNPFNDELTIPSALRPGYRQPDGTLLPPNPSSDWQVRTSAFGNNMQLAPDPGSGRQDAMGARARSSFDNQTGQTWPLPDAGTHQLWPGNGVVANYPDPRATGLLYHIRLQVSTHSFTSSSVQTLVDYFDPIKGKVPKGTIVPNLPDSTIYGFNGTFPGPRINAEYGKPVVVRFENDLDYNANCLDRQDFGAPDWAFLTHLHNGHTAPESDGQPHHMTDNLGGYQPQEWVDNLYLNYPAGGDDREKQSFFWFHDHRMHHTGANVYKGMVGLFPIYDPILDNGDETAHLKKGSPSLGLPGRRVNNPDGTFDVKYDIPMALYDVALDDGATQHEDFHNGCGELHPEWWGKQYFRHFPNHGFVGDIFTINGTAYPVLHVFRRKYRLRFLDASVSRIYQLWLMTSTNGPVAAPFTQGQYEMRDGQQCMKWTQIASEGGLLPNPKIRNSFELWPAKRREFVVDFTHFMATPGHKAQPTKPGDVIWLVNTLTMSTGREPDNFPASPNKPPQGRGVPMMKIVIVGDPPEKDVSRVPPSLREGPPFPPQQVPSRRFKLERGSAPDDPETEWVINGLQFDPLNPLALPAQGVPETWEIDNGGGGWVHPMHLHMEEHHILSRNGVPSPDALHPDDTGKEDVIALYPGESTILFRNFRTFKGKYVAHCHNLAHEDHNMMFGWTIR